jgi:hypothetical protein
MPAMSNGFVGMFIHFYGNSLVISNETLWSVIRTEHETLQHTEDSEVRKAISWRMICMMLLLHARECSLESAVAWMRGDDLDDFVYHYLSRSVNEQTE